MGSGCLIEGEWGRGIVNFLPLKRGAYQREEAYLTGGFDIGFTVYFTTIAGVKKIIRKFFVAVPLYKGLPLYSLLTKIYFFNVTFLMLSQRN